MSDRDIENALISGAAGGLSFQQVPYECPDPSFEYVTDSDTLKPAVVTPYEPPSEIPSTKKTLHDQGEGPTPVPDLDDVQPFMSEPDFVEKKESEELEALLVSQYIQNSYPRPGDTALLSSYSSEPPQSAHSINLRKQTQHAIASAWKFDPVGCSVKASFRVARDLAASPNHGLTEEEYRWIIMGGKLTRVRKARNRAWVDFAQARNRSEWIKSSDEDNEVLNLTASNIDQELDEFYGVDGIDLRPIDHDSGDEGFSEPNAIVNSMVSLPDKSLMEEGVTPGGIFQDSGISMDEGYAEYSHAHSLPNSAKETTGMVPSDWPTFNADIAPLRVPKQKGRWLGLIGDQKQCEWPGRRQGPYDIRGLRSWIHASKNDHVEILDERETSDGTSQDMARSSTPQPVTREPSVARDIEASVGRNVEAAGAKIPAVLPVVEVRDRDQMADAPIGNATHETQPPSATTSSIESGNGAQLILVPMQDKVNGDPSKAVPQFFGQEHSSRLHGSNDNGGDIAIPEHINYTFVPKKVVENSEASIGRVQSASEERPQHFSSSTGDGSDGGPSAHVIQGVLQVDIDANTHTRRGIPTTSSTTPVNHRIRQIHQVHVDTPSTPATVNIDLTPEYNSDMDTDDASSGSLEVALPNSPTANTQKGQSALGRYVQETKSHSNFARPSSSMFSLDGSKYEEVSLIPTQEHPSQPEGHAGFRKGVEIHQKKSDAAFTLTSPKASQGTPSSSKTAPIPVTPAQGMESTSFRPTTPFQFGTPTHLDFDSPGTPTPAPKASKANGKCVMNTPSPKARKADSKSITNIFKSPMLGNRSPERARSSSAIVAAPFTPMTEAADQYHGSPFGGQGLLFHKAKGNEKGTKNVLNSLQLNPERGSGSFLCENMDDYEDELAGETGTEGFKGAKGASTTGPGMALGGKEVAQAVVVQSKARSRNHNEGAQSQDGQTDEPRKKKPKKSMRAGPFDH